VVCLSLKYAYISRDLLASSIAVPFHIKSVCLARGMHKTRLLPFRGKLVHVSLYSRLTLKTRYAHVKPIPKEVTLENQAGGPLLHVFLQTLA
jgi:hypothetical protein